MSISSNTETTRRTKRAYSLDIARGAMLLLIALAHAPLYLYMNEPGIMHRVASTDIWDQLVNLFGMLIIDNRARAMFAILFGYGLVLSYKSQLSKGKKEEDAVKTIKRRSWYLILFGGMLAVFIGGQDILMAYGISGLLVSSLLLRNKKTWSRTFLIMTSLYAIFLPVVWGFIMQSTGSYGFAPDVSAQDTYVNTMFIRLFIFPVIPVFIHLMFPVLPSILLGMWMANYELLTKPEKHIKTLSFISIIGLAISLLGALPLILLGTAWYPSLFVAGVVQALHILTGIAGGFAYAAIFGIIGARLKNPGCFSLALIALGKRSLTFFVWNEALLVLFLSPVALNLGGRVSNGFSALLAVAVWILSILLATILERKNLQGPLEIALRKLVHKKQ
ncbi:DUF418 domain-containing protein [Priestia taiwanensis]|uniref:DUF418 domain-containing protein n=1 Tax=Priestia taiwanensis TaxID=1347902 RepID=A0A917EL17_9BACI|nr:DUF418 domain-containing protein [Priestia taiwanensis]MBM7361834.1 putative membrane protein YeiB [Priestia taiwanensis]GGE57313.1 hypothetical protein GCM10007140_04590 [Priestia taiwanensis]